MQVDKIACPLRDLKPCDDSCLIFDKDEFEAQTKAGEEGDVRVACGITTLVAAAGEFLELQEKMNDKLSRLDLRGLGSGGKGD